MKADFAVAKPPGEPSNRRDDGGIRARKKSESGRAVKTPEAPIARTRRSPDDVYDVTDDDVAVAGFGKKYLAGAWDAEADTCYLLLVVYRIDFSADF